MIRFNDILEQVRFGKAGAGCIFLAKKTGRLLLPQRSQYVLEPNKWGTWGGKMDEGETPEMTVKREISEESGYNGSYQLIRLGEFREKNFTYYNYLAIVDNEFTPILNPETQNYKWIDYGDWPAPLHFGLKYIIKVYGAKIQRIIEKFKNS